MGDLIVRDAVVYRCHKCGALAYASDEDGPPKRGCSCYKGPRWVRGVWFRTPSWPAQIDSSTDG